jgi:hypothetical protein
MSTDPASVGIDAAPRCPRCGQLGEFGYRCRDGTMPWFCAEHRLAQFWADARMPSLPSNDNDNPHQQADLAAAESNRASLSDPVDVLPWDPAGVDRHLVRQPAATRSRPAPIAVDRTPHFDEAGRFIHPCCKCGRDAHLGIAVNLRVGALGTWFCTQCKPAENRN